eukprot:TRINITY_DN11788_c0_g3_i1.p1 TRINITY_DN11788_c0_g3~~TRINITY_DN11788_c0_g3_i1.p1  ORF type:complete len:118 (-),score=1.06 TRINITY_DN11788_c0_g3_i1:90-443(-)
MLHRIRCFNIYVPIASIPYLGILARYAFWRHLRAMTNRKLLPRLTWYKGDFRGSWKVWVWDARGICCVCVLYAPLCWHAAVCKIHTTDPPSTKEPLKLNMHQNFTEIEVEYHNWVGS